ncbi:MAG TPA: ABC transporter permease [Thermoanaerobaculia bacterium]
MTTLFSIASRELREKKFVFGGALIVALLPLFAALMPASSRWGRPAVITLLGSILATGFALALATVLGSSTIGRDLTDNRLSFYFSKPLSPAALWFGKALASLITIFVCLGITIAIPATLAYTSARELLPEDVGAIVLFVSIGAVALFALSHTFSSMLRSRTALIVVDVLLLVGTVYALVLLLGPILGAGAMKLTTRIASGFAIAFVVLLLVAPVWQLSRGRTDRRRSHFELSKFVWAGVVALLLVTGAVVFWAVNVSPNDLAQPYASALSAGDWLAVSGDAKNRADLRPFFFANRNSGQFVRLLNPMVVNASRNGRFVAWSEAELGRKAAFSVKVRELDGGRTIDTGVYANTALSVLGLSDDGSRLAIFNRDSLTVHDLQRRALLASVRLPLGSGGYNDHLYFVTPDLIRIFDLERGNQLTVYELDVPRRAVTVTGKKELAPGVHVSWMSEDGSRLMLSDWRSRSGTILADARTLQTIADLGVIGIDAHVLSDGTVAAIKREAGTPHLRVVNLRGEVLRDYALSGDGAYIDAEVAPGKLVVAWAKRGDKRSWTMQTVDVASGKTIHSITGLHPTNLLGFRGTDPRMPAIDARPRVAESADGVFTWNALTGEKKKLF